LTQWPATTLRKIEVGNGSEEQRFHACGVIYKKVGLGIKRFTNADLSIAERLAGLCRRVELGCRSVQHQCGCSTDARNENGSEEDCGGTATPRVLHFMFGLFFATCLRTQCWRRRGDREPGCSALNRRGDSRRRSLPERRRCCSAFTPRTLDLRLCCDAMLGAQPRLRSGSLLRRSHRLARSLVAWWWWLALSASAWLYSASSAGAPCVNDRLCSGINWLVRLCMCIWSMWISLWCSWLCRGDACLALEVPLLPSRASVDLRYGNWVGWHIDQGFGFCCGAFDCFSHWGEYFE